MSITPEPSRLQLNLYQRAEKVLEHLQQLVKECYEVRDLAEESAETEVADRFEQLAADLEDLI